MKRVKKGGKVGKAMKGKKGYVKEPSKTWEAFVKRAHSKTWHAEEIYCLSKLGLTKSVAGERASAAARKKQLICARSER